ncbi:uncharacterized protein FTJAE_13320 [Fusarium tjaetaba]|uniref:Uncharacterized protein n=1 Tax=Fusarium tjaetaba TaxID=1567544 RepID=A0A8H5VAV7_9HYPO|nr:uncharacterized protein FTJAE_13320 [Fusarium tjaetaba]KAF5615618.1 hypothetical protein FTJAE_13320 [Fusarium tjaetaba]
MGNVDHTLAFPSYESLLRAGPAVSPIQHPMRVQLEQAGLSPGHRVFFLLPMRISIASPASARASRQMQHQAAGGLTDNSRTPGADAYAIDRHT